VIKSPLSDFQARFGTQHVELIVVGVHHPLPLGEIFRDLVGAANFVVFLTRELPLDGIGPTRSVFVGESRRDSTKSVSCHSSPS
jgi:hypothetical protein